MVDLNFTKEEKALLNAKTPAAYIDKSVKSNISSGRKAVVTKQWLEKTGHTIDDIKYARNRHPYWKEKKMEGTAERNSRRSKEHNYNSGDNITWTKELLSEFLDLNKKDRSGKYIKRDWELAQHFQCTIAGVQHIRRKSNMAHQILDAKKEKVSKSRLMNHLKMGETELRQIRNGLIKPSRKKKKK